MQIIRSSRLATRFRPSLWALIRTWSVLSTRSTLADIFPLFFGAGPFAWFRFMARLIDRCPILVCLLHVELEVPKLMRIPPDVGGVKGKHNRYIEKTEDPLRLLPKSRDASPWLACEDPSCDSSYS